MNRETLLKELEQAREDIALTDGADSSFHYYQGLIDGLERALKYVKGENE